MYEKPWIDGQVALAAVLPAIGSMTVAITIALPVKRGPVSWRSRWVPSTGCRAAGAEKLDRYRDAGAERILVWPVGDELHQLERFHDVMSNVG